MDDSAKAAPHHRNYQHKGREFSLLLHQRARKQSLQFITATESSFMDSEAQPNNSDRACFRDIYLQVSQL